MRAIEAKSLNAEVQRQSGRKLVAACITRAGHAPSRALVQAIDGLPATVAGQVEVVQIDIDDDDDAMDALRVFKVPELIFYAGGRIVERTEGALDVAQATALVEYVLAHMVPA